MRTLCTLLERVHDLRGSVRYVGWRQVGGLMCLAVNTKMAIIEGGALQEMVDLLGSGSAKAIVQVRYKGSTP